MSNNDPITKADLQSLKDFITRENRELDDSINEKIESVKSDVKNLERKTDALQQGVSNLKRGQERIENRVDNLENKVDNLENKFDNLENKVDNLTDAVIEGFDNTERILSDWEGTPVNLLSKQTKSELQEPLENHKVEE